MKRALFSFLILTTPTLADDQVPPVMYEFLGQIFRVQPLMFSTSEFTKKANEAKIKEALTQLSAISKRLPHTTRLETASFQVSVSAMQAHLQDLTAAFNSGRKEYARRMLVATLDGCSSCHTQVPGRNLPRWNFREDEIKGGNFEKAEFLFAVRHYEEALKAYESFLLDFNPKKDEASRVETALRRVLVIYVRVLRNPARGLLFFEAQEKNVKLPKHMRSDIKGWMKGLEDLKKTPAPDAQKATRAEVEAYAQKTIEPLLEKRGAKFEPQSFVSFLAASGMIAEFINTRSSKEITANLLYMLGRCDAQIAHGYFFSLTDNYLRECISRFPGDKMAHKCYAELEASQTEAFTGSRGVDMPPDVKEELRKYRKMLGMPAKE